MATADLFAPVADKPLTQQLPDRRRLVVAALILWALPMIVITAMVIHNPFRHTVTIDSYHWSAKNWWARQSLYIGPSGMNYLPHFAILYTPFHLLPMTLSEVLWRWCAAVSLVVSISLTVKELFGARWAQPFLWVTIVAMPLSLGALRNGNSNAVFGGVTLLAVVAIIRQRWWLAIAWMVLATALKPLGIVLILLSTIYYWPLARRMPLALITLFVFPFLFGSPDYVWGQYQEASRNLRSCAAVTEHRFADLNGILRTIGTPLSPSASTLIRILAGGLTAAAWLWGARRLNSTFRCLWLYALTTTYLMLFNPMSESNSYVILAPTLGIWAACFLSNEEPAARRLGWGVVGIALSMGLLPSLFRPWFGNHFALFWHPLMSIIFLGALIHFISRAGDEKHCPMAVTNP